MLRSLIFSFVYNSMFVHSVFFFIYFFLFRAPGPSVERAALRYSSRRLLRVEEAAEGQAAFLYLFPPEPDG